MASLLVKDNIDTGDRMMTSVGSLALTEPAPQDAEVVARLRGAGALILGKTNPAEWVNRAPRIAPRASNWNYLLWCKVE